MWTCDKCQRVFQKDNQYHICVVKDVGELFVDRPDRLVLAWDYLTELVMAWQPNVYSASTKSIVYTSKKAWLIVKPMKDKLDIKFYHDDKLDSTRFARISSYRNKFAYHIRVREDSQIDDEVIDLLRMGYDYSMR